MAVKKFLEVDYDPVEAEALRDLRHKNIIHCFGFYKTKTHRCFLFEPAICNLEEYLENDNDQFNSLRSKISVKTILQNTTEGLNHMHFHNKRYFHLDLKPENILILESEIGAKAVICDLGSCKTNNKFSNYREPSGVPRATPVSFLNDENRNIFFVSVQEQIMRRRVFFP